MDRKCVKQFVLSFYRIYKLVMLKIFSQYINVPTGHKYVRVYDYIIQDEFDCELLRKLL